MNINTNLFLTYACVHLITVDSVRDMNFIAANLFVFKTFLWNFNLKNILFGSKLNLNNLNFFKLQ